MAPPGQFAVYAKAEELLSTDAECRELFLREGRRAGLKRALEKASAELGVPMPSLGPAFDEHVASYDEQPSREAR
jgi:hypothetical protein